MLCGMRDRKETSIRQLQTSIDPAKPDADGLYTVIVARNDDVNDGAPIDLKAMSFEAYRKNPVVLLAHDRWQGVPVARTHKLEWTNQGLRAWFEFLKGDDNAARVKNAWDRGFLRAASIGVRKGMSGRDELVEWSIVPVPADMDAVRSLTSETHSLAPAHQNMLPIEIEIPEVETEMDDDRIRQIVADAMKARDADKSKTRDADTIAEISRGMSGIIGESVKAAMEDAEKARAAAEEAAEKAEADFEARVAGEVEERMKKKMPFGDDKKKADDKEKMGDKKKMGDKEKAEGDDDDDDDARADAAAEERADLLLLVRDLLPEDFSTRGKGAHEILVAAVGEEVKDAADRSADYLLAKVEAIVDRRSDAGKQRSGKPSSKAPSFTGIAGGRVNMMSLKRSAK